MTPLHQSGPQRVGAIVATLALGATGFLPLFGGPGYEAALAAGLVLPTIAAIVTAVEVARTRPLPSVAVARGAATGAALATLGLAITWLHGFRVGFCDAKEGAAFFALGPGFGAVMGGVWGALAGLVGGETGATGSRKLAVLLALAGPLGGIGVSLWRFYSSPMVFAFDPFAGFFAGTLYDTVITGLRRLATYRIGSSLTLVAVVVLTLHCVRSASGRLQVRYLGRPGLLVLGIASAFASAGVTVYGVELGHYQTVESIREALGRSAVSRRCEVVYPTGIRKRDAHALARDCDAHVAQLEKYFETKGPDRIVVFVFSNPEQKGRLVGAANTYIAKPWRREVYIQRAGYPHRVLRHELTHVMAGAFGAGPFEVSGPLGGWVPDPGRIEGVAVAAAPKASPLTLQQWAKAMKDLDLLPPLSRVFRLTFLGEPSSRAYAVAGAFIEWFRETHGVEALKKWYGGERLAAVAEGNGLTALEREWHASLKKVRVSDEAMHVARARFDRPAIFGRRCPHIVDRHNRMADWALRQLDPERARQSYDDALELDPHNVRARFGHSECALRENDVPEAKKRYQALAEDESVAKTTRARAIETLGDLALAEGKTSEATKAYDAVAELVVDEGRLRGLDVKRYAAKAGGMARESIVKYLVGTPEAGRDAQEASIALGAWSVSDEKLGLADYLMGRNDFNGQRWESAAARFDVALERKLPLERVAREARRSRVIVACATGDRATARQHYDVWKKERGISSAEKAFMERFIERCEMKKGFDKPKPP